MDPSAQIDHAALLTTVRVIYALELFPRLVGSKQRCVEWMSLNLNKELSALSLPTKFSPHPRILGSLTRVLGNYYLSGMRMESLNLHEVCPDDPHVSGEEYVDVSHKALPKLEGSDFWWNSLPPSVQLSSPSPPRTSPSVSVEDSSQGSSQRRRTVRLKLPEDPWLARRSPTPPSPLSSPPLFPPSPSLSPPRPSVSGNAILVGGAGVIDPERTDVPQNEKKTKSCRLKHGRIDIRSPDEKTIETDGEATPLRKKRRKTARMIDHTDDSDDSEEADASNAAHMNPHAQPKSTENEEPLQDCDPCRSRGSECVWPGGSGSRKACFSCISQKKRCYIDGVFAIRRPRGKAAAFQSFLPQFSNQLSQILVELKELRERMSTMEKKISARIK